MRVRAAAMAHARSRPPSMPPPKRPPPSMPPSSDSPSREGSMSCSMGVPG